MAHDELTKESYTARFPDNFQLAHHAIHVAQTQIQGGNEDLNVTAMLKDICKERVDLDEIDERS